MRQMVGPQRFWVPVDSSLITSSIITSSDWLMGITVSMSMLNCRFNSIVKNIIWVDSRNNNGKKLHSGCWMSDIFLSTLHSLTHVILVTNAWFRGYYYTHFMGEENEAQRSYLPCPRSHSYWMAELGFETRFSSSTESMPSHLHSLTFLGRIHPGKTTTVVSQGSED